jgi:tetratricopeptide (TPR) repeat protein
MNKKNICIKFLLIIFLINFFSYQYSFAMSAGETSLNFLKIATDVRSIGMGESSVAVESGVNSLSSNPAGIASSGTTQTVFMYNQWFQDIKSQYAAIAVPLYKRTNAGNIKNLGTFGFSVNYLSIDNIQGYDDMGGVTSKLHSYDLALSLAYAKNISEFLNSGVNVKYITESLSDTKASAYAMDLGLVCNTLVNWSFGFSAQNFINTSIKFIEEDEKLPVNYKLGVKYTREIFSQPLTLALDENMPVDNDPYTCVGAEYWIKDIFAIRTGYRSNVDEGSGIRVGLGFKTSLFQVDYAYAGFGDLGDTHRVSINFRFGSGIQFDRKEQLYNYGLTLYKEGRYSEAIRTFNEALQIDPRDRKSLDMLNKTYSSLDSQYKDVKKDEPNTLQKNMDNELNKKEHAVINTEN